MLRLTHVLFIVYCLYVVSEFHNSHTIVTPPSPLPSPSQKSMSNLGNEQIHKIEPIHNLEQKRTSLESIVLFKIVVTVIIVIFLSLRIFFYMCLTVRYITFSTNLNILRKNKTTSMLTRSVRSLFLAFSLLLLLGLLLSEFPEN